MNLKEKILELYTVTDVEITKGQFSHGVPCTDFKVYTRHPETGKMYYHLMQLSNSAMKEMAGNSDAESAVVRLIKSTIKDWWTPNKLKDLESR